jgi:CheY-like chemotaxis protein
MSLSMLRNARLLGGLTRRTSAPGQATREKNMPIVLVVEDEPLIRHFVRFELEEAGFTVLEAANADRAVALLEARGDIQLIFTDVDMPGSMDGAKLAAAVRDRWPPIHIIITSGKSQPAAMPENSVFIPKPYIGRNVVAAMRAFANMS